MKFFKGECIADKIPVPLSLLANCYQQGEDLCLISDYTTYRTKLINEIELAEYASSEYLGRDLIFIELLDRQEVEIDAYNQNLLKRFHWTWYNRLQHYLNSEEFRGILRAVLTLYKKDGSIQPQKENLFNCFLKSYEELAFAFLGLSPYPQKATGYAFSSYEKKLPVSLKIIESSIRKECSKNFLWGISGDLTRIHHAGGFLFNSALSTNSSDAASHATVWNPFTKRIIQELEEKSAFTWLSFGSTAKTFLENNTKHKLFTLQHPAYCARNGTPLDSKGAFKYLEETYKFKL